MGRLDAPPCNAALGWFWADPVSGLVIAAVAVQEGLKAWRADVLGAVARVRADQPLLRTAPDPGRRDRRGRCQRPSRLLRQLVIRMHVRVLRGPRRLRRHDNHQEWLAPGLTGGGGTWRARP